MVLRNWNLFASSPQKNGWVKATDRGKYDIEPTQDRATAFSLEEGQAVETVLKVSHYEVEFIQVTPAPVVEEGAPILV